MTAQLPSQRPAQVTVVMRDGRRLSASTGTNRGDWADPFTEGEVHDKFMSLTARAWSREKSQAVWEAALTLDNGDGAAFLDLLALPS